MILVDTSVVIDYLRSADATLLALFQAHDAAICGVTRAEVSPSGLTAFLRGDADPDAIVRGVLQRAHISGFRVRAADLAEVFRALDPAGQGTTAG